jgi:hypothetical protein
MPLRIRSHSSSSQHQSPPEAGKFRSSSSRQLDLVKQRMNYRHKTTVNALTRQAMHSHMGWG